MFGMRSQRSWGRVVGWEVCVCEGERGGFEGGKEV